MFLKQSTASQAIKLGPFLDDTDGKTAETGLTVANTDIQLSKAGGTFAAKNSGGGTHDADGWYTATLDATDTATVGTLDIQVVVTGALPVFSRYYVLEEAIYDAMFAASATGLLPANVTQISGSATAADNLEASALAIETATATGGSGTTVTTTDITEATADHWKGRVIVFTSGTLFGQATTITASAFATGTTTFTVDTLTDTPTTETFVIL